jgi:hypothetical protein
VAVKRRAIFAIPPVNFSSQRVCVAHCLDILLARRSDSFAVALSLAGRRWHYACVAKIEATLAQRLTADFQHYRYPCNTVASGEQQ